MTPFPLLSETRRDAVRNFAGEMTGTFILTLFGCGSVAVSVLYNAHTGLLQLGAVWGIGVTFDIYSTRDLSFAHLNPAGSLAMAIVGRMSTKKLPIYILGQLLGATMAGMVIYLIFFEPIASFEAVHSIVRGSKESVRTA